MPLNPEAFPPDSLVMAGTAILVIAVLVLWWLRREDPYPFERCPVLTDAERAFLAVLDGCVPRGVRLLSKVRMADYLRVRSGTKHFMRHFGRISQKHADFLLVDAETAEPLLVIELDDSSHRRAGRTMENDAFKDAACAAAGLPILRVRTARRYPAAELRAAIAEALGRD